MDDGEDTAGAAQRQADVLIIGGGPAGSTAAALLARRGISVELLERARHPRFHIGESLLPANLPLFEQLGVADQVRRIGMRKNGAQLYSHWDGRRSRLCFADAWDKSMPYAYHVRRSQLDELLLRHAEGEGARVHEGWRALSVQWAGEGPVSVQAQSEAGHTRRWSARFLLDASGRETFLASRLGLKRRNPRHDSAALYAHYRDARHDEGELAGDIALYWFDHGWFWFIPLADGTTSVGAVVWPNYLRTRHGPVDDFFDATLAQCPPLAERLTGAQRVTAVSATGNYSYSARRTHGSNYLLLGDAYAFIDPVFSTGVMLAMQNAFAAAGTVETCLRRPARAATALRHYDRSARRGPREFSWFIYRMTSPAMRDLFLEPRNPLRMQEALLSLLAGDLFGRTPIWPSLRAFKLLYRLMSLGHPRRSLRSLRERRVNIRPVRVGAGTHG